nr:MAG TPA: antitoxin [Caudoviricetes sp.]
MKCPCCGKDDLILYVKVELGAFVNDYGELELLEENMGDVMDCVLDNLGVRGKCYACKQEVDVKVTKELKVKQMIPKR